MPFKDTEEFKQCKPCDAVLAYSFVVPIYNDGYLAEAFCHEFLTVFQQHFGTQTIQDTVELLFIDDGSSDDSLAILRRIAEKHPFVKVMALSRNFGQHVALLCGYHNAKGAYVGRLNADMQDPPSEIPKLIREFQRQDVDMVVGIQEKRYSKKSDTITARLFFWAFNLLIGGQIPQNTASLRLMNRRYVDALKSMNDKFPFLQGLEAWIGLRVSYTPTRHQERKDSKSSYTFFRRLKLAINAAISFSDRPLKGTVYLGMILALIGGVGLLAVIAAKLVSSNVVPGYTSLAVIILFCSGIQIFVTGLSGIYIGKILTHVQQRPLYLVRECIHYPISKSLDSSPT